MLEKQGLLIDKTNARKQFQRIGYFRLRSYLYPLLDTPKSLGLFKPGATFEQAMELYKFDRKLRLLVFSQIEKIEIAVRCQLVTIGCKEIGAVDWLYQESNFLIISNLFKPWQCCPANGSILRRILPKSFKQLTERLFPLCG